MNYRTVHDCYCITRILFLGHSVFKVYVQLNFGSYHLRLVAHHLSQVQLPDFSCHSLKYNVLFRQLPLIEEVMPLLGVLSLI